MGTHYSAELNRAAILLKVENLSTKNRSLLKRQNT